MNDLKDSMNLWVFSNINNSVKILDFPDRLVALLLKTKNILYNLHQANKSLGEGQQFFTCA